MLIYDYQCTHCNKEMLLTELALSEDKEKCCNRCGSLNLIKKVRDSDLLKFFKQCEGVLK